MADIKTIYNFTIGKNLYSIRLADISKVTFLQHNVVENENDTQELVKIFHVFTVSGDIMPQIDKDALPTRETIIEIQADENDYNLLYKTYQDLIGKWDEYHFFALSSTL